MFFKILIIFFVSSLAVIEEGSLYSANSWTFLQYYSFKEKSKSDESNSGSVEFEGKILDTSGSHNYKLTVYYDSGLTWNTLYNNRKYFFRVKSDYTCYDKVFTNVSNSQIRTFSLYSPISSVNSEDGYTFKISIPVETSRPRIFFFAVSNCVSHRCRGTDCQAPIRISNYRLNLLNGNGKFKNLPHNEKSFYGLSLTMMIIYIAMLLFSIVIFLLNKKQNCRIYSIIISVVMFIYLLSYILLFAYYNTIKAKAKVNLGIKYSSEIVNYLGESIFLCQMLISSKALHIYRHKLSLLSRIKVGCYCLFYFLYLFSVYYAYEIITTPTIRAQYFIEKPITVWYILLRVITIIWYTYSWYTTYNNYNIHLIFNILQLSGLIYLCILPLIYLILYASDTLYRDLYLQYFISIPSLVIHIIYIVYLIPCFPFYQIYKNDFISNYIPSSVYVKSYHTSEVVNILQRLASSKSKVDSQILIMKENFKEFAELISLISQDLSTHIDDDSSKPARIVTANKNDFSTVELKKKTKK